MSDTSGIPSEIQYPVNYTGGTLQEHFDAMGDAMDAALSPNVIEMMDADPEVKEMLGASIVRILTEEGLNADNSLIVNRVLYLMQAMMDMRDTGEDWRDAEEERDETLEDMKRKMFGRTSDE